MFLMCCEMVVGVDDQMFGLLVVSQTTSSLSSPAIMLSCSAILLLFITTPRSFKMVQSSIKRLDDV